MDFEELELGGADDVRRELERRRAEAVGDAEPWAWARRLAHEDAQAAAWVVQALTGALEGAASADGAKERTVPDALRPGVDALGEALGAALAGGHTGALGDAAAFYVYSAPSLGADARQLAVAAIAHYHPGLRAAFRDAVELQAGRFGAFRATPVVDELDDLWAAAQAQPAEGQREPTADQLDALLSQTLSEAGEALKRALGELDLSAADLLDALASLVDEGQGGPGDNDAGQDGGRQPPDAGDTGGARGAESEPHHAPERLGFDPRPVFHGYVWEHGLAIEGEDGVPTVRVDVAFLLEHGPGLVQAFLPLVRGGERAPSGAGVEPPAPVRVETDLGLDELQRWVTGLLAALGR